MSKNSNNNRETGILNLIDTLIDKADALYRTMGELEYDCDEHNAIRLQAEVVESYTEALTFGKCI